MPNGKKKISKTLAGFGPIHKNDSLIMKQCQTDIDIGKLDV